MALTKEASWTKRQDWMRTLIKQCNSCPICHLPLLYDWPTFNRGQDIENADFWWYKAQQAMKEGERQSDNLFGTNADTVNAEVCHYVASTYVPEITRPLLYETPASAGPLSPEDGYYLNPTLARQPLVTWDIRNIFTKPIPTRRHMRLSSMFSLTGTKWFLGCRDCNQNHTGNKQVEQITKEVLHLDFNPDNATQDVANIYTLLFDIMAKGNAEINVTKERCETWHIELWINYCLIMFLAQHKSSEGRAKFKEAPETAWTYAFHYGHRDVGLCDFYMSQMLAAILYANYDIDVDFIWLHQMFLAYLPRAAQNCMLFHAPTYSYKSLWRLVMGTPVDDGPLAEISDLSYVSGDRYNTDENVYWLDVSNVRKAADLVMRRLTLFTHNWLESVGHMLDTRGLKSTIPDSIPVKLSQYQHLENIAIYGTNQDNYYRLRTLTIHHRNGADSNPFLYQEIEKDPNLDTVEYVMSHFSTTNFKTFLYSNTMKLALARQRVAYQAIKATFPPGTVDPIEKKWFRVIKAMEYICSKKRTFEP